MTRDQSPTPTGLRLVTSLAVAAICFASFGWNLFGAAVPELREHPTAGERLVLDALAADGVTLGYLGPDGLAPYLSQYGAHLDFYRALGVPVEWLHLLNAGLLSAVIGVIAWLLGRHVFSARGVLAFGLTLALSPIVIKSSDNLYWCMWTWFLPMALSLAVGPMAFRVAGAVLLTGLLFLALLWSNLLGYEYASTIALAAAAPLACLGLRRGAGILRTGLVCALPGLAAVGAMVAAFALHAHKIAAVDGAASGEDVIEAIVDKRAGGAGAEDAARLACALEPETSLYAGAEREAFLATCTASVTRTQNASVGTVLATYATFRWTVPYLSGKDLLNDDALAPVRQSLRRLDLSGVMSALADAPGDLGLSLARLPLTMLVAWILVLATLRKLWTHGRDMGPEAAMLGIAVLAPLSWFILAKAHSYGHTQFNFVLWNLPFLPLMMGVLLDRRDIRA